MPVEVVDRTIEVGFNPILEKIQARFQPEILIDPGSINGQYPIKLDHLHRELPRLDCFWMRIVPLKDASQFSGDSTIYCEEFGDGQVAVLEPLKITNEREKLFISVNGSQTPLLKYLRSLPQANTYFSAFTNLKHDEEKANKSMSPWMEPLLDEDDEVLEDKEVRTDYKCQPPIIVSDGFRDAVNQAYRRAEAKFTSTPFSARLGRQVLDRNQNAQDHDTPWGHQPYVLRLIGESMVDETSPKHLLISSPPGTGKTRMIAELMHLSGETKDPDALIVYVTGTRLALNQAIKDIQAHYQELNGQNAYFSLARFFTQHDRIEDWTRYVFTTYYSIPQLIRFAKVLGRKVQMVFFDEAHHLTRDREKMYKTLGLEDTLVTAWTGTPWGRKHLVEIGFHELYSLHVTEAIRRGTLPPIQLFRVVTSLEKDTKEVLKEGDGKMDNRKLDSLIRDQLYQQTVVNVFLDRCTIRDENGKIVGFQKTLLEGYSIKQAQAILENLRSNSGLDGSLRSRIGIISSHQRQRLNEEILSKFKSGEIDVVIAIDMMRESIDLPGLECLIKRPTCSRIALGQTVGRGLRGTDKVFKVYEIFHTPYAEEARYSTVPQFLGLEMFIPGQIIRGDTQHDRITKDLLAKRINNSVDDQISELIQLNATYNLVNIPIITDGRPYGEHLLAFPQLIYRLFQAYQLNPNFVNLEWELQENGIFPEQLLMSMSGWIEEGMLPEEILNKKSKKPYYLDKRPVIQCYFEALNALQIFTRRQSSLADKLLGESKVLLEDCNFPPLIEIAKTFERNLLALLREKIKLQTVDSNDPRIDPLQYKLKKFFYSDPEGQSIYATLNWLRSKLGDTYWYVLKEINSLFTTTRGEIFLIRYLARKINSEAD